MSQYRSLRNDWLEYNTGEMLGYNMVRMLDTGDTVVVVYIYLLLFFSLSMKICDSACSAARPGFYYWTREFNQAIVFLSGQDVQWICSISLTK